MSRVSPPPAGRGARPELLSIVVPVRNEERNIPVLVERLRETLAADWSSWEAIFVTDLNTDGTVRALREAHERDARVKAIKLSNAFGHHVAVYAGLAASSGDAVVVMDGDLQDWPEDIPRLVEKYQEGFDVVYGIKERKNESRWRNALSSFFLHVLRRLSDHDLDFNTSMFRIMSRRTVDELMRFGETEPSVTALISLIGFPTAKVLVTSGTRETGKTNYGLARQMNFAISWLLSFSTKPLRLISLLGLTVASLSLLYFIVVVVQTLVRGSAVLGWPTVVVLVTFLSGTILFAQGLTGEYIARIFIETKRRPLYVVEELIGEVRSRKS